SAPTPSRPRWCWTAVMPGPSLGAPGCPPRSLFPEQEGPPMIMVNGIQVLCGATAEQAANEDAGQGFFTAALVQALSTPHDPPLLALPLDLGAWFHALPAELLGP